jgi:hypothetical protein
VDPDEPMTGHGGSLAPPPQSAPEAATTAQPTAAVPPARGKPPQSVHLIDLRSAVPEGISDLASGHFREFVFRFALDLSREASRLEEEKRVKGIDDPEVTTSMVVNANDVVRNPSAAGSQPKADVVIAQAVAFVLAISTGIAGAYLHSVFHWILTIGLGLIALGAQAYSIATPLRRK